MRIRKRRHHSHQRRQQRGWHIYTSTSNSRRGNSSSSITIVDGFIILILLISNFTIAFSQQQQQQTGELFGTCLGPKPSISNETKEYLVGGNTWHIPIVDYLTKYVGMQFDPPISFKRQTANQYLISPREVAQNIGYDFMVANPYASSCYHSEGQAVSLATQIMNNNYNAHTQQYYNLTQYGATLYVLANRTDIQTLDDVKGKTIGTNKITNLATHLCYDILLRHGIHHLQDPKQTIFFRRSDHALDAVLSGDVDVGCAATDTLEKYVDSNNKLLDIDNQIRILNPQRHYTDGIEFPFRISSILVPGYQFQVFPHVPSIVSSKLQYELLAMREHADIVPSLLGCLDGKGCYTNETSCVEECFNELPSSMFTNCDTTPTKAIDAYEALQATNRVLGYTRQLSNLKLRDMQETTGFLIKDDDTTTTTTTHASNTGPSSSSSSSSSTGGGGPRCVRLNNVVDAVTCPEGHFVRTTSEIVQQCNVSGLPCHDRPCICSPCVKAFEVDFFPIITEDKEGEEDEDEEESQAPAVPGSSGGGAVGGVGSGCSKFSVCGTVQQEHGLTFRAIDNRYKERPNSSMTGAFLLPDESELPFNFTKYFIMRNDNETSSSSSSSSSSGSDYYFQFDFMASNMTAGQKFIKIRINNEEIPESPFRINVVKRDCVTDSGDSNHEPNEYGECVCKSGMVELSNGCVSLAILIIIIFVPILVLILLGVHLYVKHKKDQADNIWKIDPDELLIDDPPRILGRGTFGLVLLAEYRGTPVAFKQILPTDTKCERTSPPSYVEFNMSKSGAVSNHKNSNHNSHNVGVLSALGMASRSPNVDVPSSRPTGKYSFFRRNRVIGGIVEGMGHLKDGVLMKRHTATHHSFIEEIRLLSRLRHPAITTVMGAVSSSKLEPLLVMEYMHFGSLHDLLQNESMILEGDVLVGFLQDVASGLRFLHSSDPLVLHGDLKSQNILVDDKFRAKVADFGCGHYALACNSDSTRNGKARGTPYWMAPELLRGESTNTIESDVYAFGIVIYEVFSRQEPYAGEPYDEVLRLVSCQEVNKRPPVPDNCPSEAAKMMKACLNSDPACRPTATGLDICFRWMDGSEIKTPASIISRQINKAEAASNDSRGSDDLFEQRFPRHIAEALREGRKVEPETHDEVTIVFSDIVGYADMASSMPATKVSDLLDRLHTKFDEICDRLEIFTVETVGDTYMAVTNMVRSQPNHAALAAIFSVEAMLVASTVPINEDDPSAGFVQLQMGFHTGPVVTHVIGTKNPRWTLIGDTVNTASRIESLSSPGKIQCSEDSYRHLSKNIDKHSAEFIPKERGMVQVKSSKGEMRTYWIEPGDGRLESC